MQQMEIRRVTPLAARASPDHGLNPFLSAASFVYPRRIQARAVGGGGGGGADEKRMNRVKEVERINAKDLQLQLASDTVGNAGVWNVNKSWHAQYKDSAYVYVGGLSDGLSEGDVIVICSQFGEVVDINMPRDKKTGKTKGFAFICYEVRAPQS